MRRLPLSTENVTSGMAFLLLRLHIFSFARDAAAVQAARGLRAVRVALTDALVSCDLNTSRRRSRTYTTASFRPKVLAAWFGFPLL